MEHMLMRVAVQDRRREIEEAVRHAAHAHPRGAAVAAPRRHLLARLRDAVRATGVSPAPVG